MARMGMDVDTVEQAGRQLKNHAAGIGDLIAQLDRVVSSLSSVWDGQDAQRFVHNWWPQHKKALAAAQASVEGLGQSALNNASEQRDVSSNPAGSGGASAVVATGGAAAAAAGSVAASAATSAQATAAATFVQRWEGQKIDPDRSWGAQCFDVFRQYSNEVVGAKPDIATDSDNASDIYNHYNTNGVSQYYTQIPYGQGTPQPGDIVVYGSTDSNSYGHVALVTAVNGNNYSVLEQNYSPPYNGTDPAAVRAHTFGERGSAPILGYLRPKQIST